MPLRGKAKTISESETRIEETGKHLAATRHPTAVFTQVPLTDIRPDPNNSRNLGLTIGDLEAPQAITDSELREEAEYIIELSNTIRQYGQLQPGVGYRTKGGTIQLIAGERRWLACQLADRDEMDVMVYADRPGNEAVTQLIENIHRRGLKPAGMCQGMLQLLEERAAGGEPITTGDQLAKVIGLPRSVAYRWWSVINGPEDVQSAMLEGRLASVYVAEELLKLDKKARARILSESGAGQLTLQDVLSHSSARKPARKAAPSLKLGAVNDGRVIKRLVEAVDPAIIPGDMDWSDLGRVKKVWKSLIDDLQESMSDSGQGSTKKKGR